MEISPELQNHWLWQNKPFAKGQAWIDLLLLSSKVQSQTIYRGKVYSLALGQIITSENELCNRWGWSRTKLRSFLLLLEEASMVELNRDKAKTLITVIQYSILQQYLGSKNHQENPAKIQVEEQEKRQDEKQVKPAQKQVIASIVKQAKKQVKGQDNNTSCELKLAKKASEPYQLTIQMK